MLDDKLKIPLHNGFIEVLLQDNEYFVTAGGDGYVKWFRISDIDSAEAEEGLDVSITPTKEILISSTPDGKNPAHIMNMILADDVWYIQDRKGRMYVMDKENDNYKCIYEFHQGHINSLVTSPSLNYAVSTGEDGVVKVWDFVRKNVVH
jgi:WD40 repeat protein